MPFRVSTAATCPIWTSFACVSADPQLGLERRRIADAGQTRPRRDALPLLDRHLLENAVHAGAYLKGRDLIEPELPDRAQTIHFRPLNGQLRRLRRFGDAETLLLQREARLVFPLRGLRPLEFDG